MKPAANSLAISSPMALHPTAQSLLDGLGSRQNAELVLGDLPWDARHVGQLPGKSVLIGAEEVDGRVFLFGRQLRPNPDRLG